MNKRLYFTPAGIERLKAIAEQHEKELRRLQAQTAHAAEVGGNQYHDNASYEFLLIQIRLADRRLQEIVDVLNQAEVVIPPLHPVRVQLGTTVVVETLQGKETWNIVGYGDSDSDRQTFSYQTPIAKLVIGATAGESRQGMVGGKMMRVTVLLVSALQEEEK